MRTQTNPRRTDSGGRGGGGVSSRQLVGDQEAGGSNPPAVLTFRDSTCDASPLWRSSAFTTLDNERRVPRLGTGGASPTCDTVFHDPGGPSGSSYSASCFGPA